ncbi:MAG: N-acetyltransferase [Desulfobulbaceae bacterium]|nr:N-acetyltransferase [Desulfobulbaceae bacterium]
MKIRKLTVENRDKVQALLKRAFPGSSYETRLIYNLHKKERKLHEWICIHTNKVIGYIAFSNAYNGNEVCGLHLAPLAIKPEHQNMGVGGELLRFALRQEEIKTKSVYVLGAPRYYEKFGFQLCSQPKCPFDKKNAHFLAIRNNVQHGFSIGYEPEFSGK